MSYEPDWYDTHCPTCDAKEPMHMLTCAVYSHDSSEGGGLMLPITSYKICPDLFGRTRWMAEIDGQHSRFARRAYSREAAERKISRDENHLYERGGATFMQGVFLPVVLPISRWHDRLCQDVDLRRRARRYRKIHQAQENGD